MPDQNGVLDGMLSEIKRSKTDWAKPKKPAVNEQESSLRSTEKRSNAKDAQHDTTTHSAGTGAASFPYATRKTTQATGELGWAELNLKIDKLVSVMNTFAPVVKELKTAYDAARNEEDILLLFWRRGWRERN